jgi:hypothetical protein
MTPPQTQLPQPLEVDNIADVWTMLTALGTLGAAVGTVAAFWLAAVSYRRQVDEQARQYASKVTVYVNALEGEMGVENLGDLPVYSVTLRAAHPRAPSQVFAAAGRLTRGTPLSVPMAPALVRDRDFRASASFTDPNGRKWTRYDNGDLVLA